MQLAAIRDVFATGGPFVTVYADVSRDSATADQALEARSTALRQQLEAAEVDDALVTAIVERLQENRHVAGDARLTLVASGDEIVFESVQQGRSTGPDETTVGLLPDLSGWLQGEDGAIGFGLVVVDREGADIDFWTAAHRPAAEAGETEGASAFHTHLAEGAGEKKEFGHATEETWKANAEEIAESVLSGVRRHRPRLVVLAGEEHVRSMVAEALEAQQVEVVQTTAGGRGAGSSQEALMSSVEETLARYVADDQQQVLDLLLARVGEGSAGRGAARGLDAVLGALVAGQVDTLVLDLDATRDLTVDPSDHPGLALPASVGDARVAANRALVAAAAATDAKVALLPAAQTGGDGVDAILRWAD